MVGISFWNLDIRIQKNLTFNRDSILNFNGKIEK